MSEIALSSDDLPEPPLQGRLSGDERLAQMASRGSARAFAVLYERHHQALYRYCRSIVREPEDARDALQSTMLHAFAALRAGPRDVAVRAWLFRIAHNESISILRRRRRTTANADTLSEKQPCSLDVERTAEQRERLALLVADLQTLAERQRAALVMRELSGLSLEEIAAALSCSPGAAKQALFEARAALQDLSEGRAMGCEAIRRAISEHDGRVLRGRKLRAHLRACSGCREFEAAIGARRADLRALAPPLPAAAGIALLRQMLASGGHVGGGGAATAAAGTSGGGVGSAATGTGGTALAGTNAGSATLGGTALAGTNAGSATLAGAGAGGGTTLGGHLLGSLAAKALAGAAVVVLAATGAVRLVEHGHARQPANAQRSAHVPGVGGVAAPGRRAALARVATQRPGGPVGANAAGLHRVPSAASAPGLSRAFGSNHRAGLTGGASAAYPAGRAAPGSEPAGGRPLVAGAPRGGTGDTHRSRRGEGSAARGGGHGGTRGGHSGTRGGHGTRSGHSGTRGGHSGTRGGGYGATHAGGHSGTGGAKAHSRDQPSRRATPSPPAAPRPAGGSGAEKQGARAHSQSSNQSSAPAVAGSPSQQTPGEQAAAEHPASEHAAPERAATEHSAAAPAQHTAR